MSSQPNIPSCTRAFTAVLQRLESDGFVPGRDNRPYAGFLQAQDPVIDPSAIRRHEIREVVHLGKDHEGGRLLVSVFRMESTGEGRDAGGVVSACHEFNGKLVRRPLVPSLGSFAALREFVKATDPSAGPDVRMSPTEFIYRLTQPQVFF